MNEACMSVCVCREPSSAVSLCIRLEQGGRERGRRGGRLAAARCASVRYRERLVARRRSGGGRGSRRGQRRDKMVAGEGPPLPPPSAAAAASLSQPPFPRLPERITPPHLIFFSNSIYVTILCWPCCRVFHTFANR